MPFARIEVPGILSIEGDDHQEVALLALLVADPPEAGHEVPDRVAGRHALVLETDAVAEYVVAEDRHHRGGPTLQRPGLVEQLGTGGTPFSVPVQRAVQRPAEDVLVADEPLHSGFDGQPHHVFGDRHLRRP